MAMTLHPAKGRPQSAWKNGKGVTSELAIFPRDADLETFGWRVSIAEVRESGPFSNFPGIDRLLAVLEGTLALSIDGAAAVSLSAGTRSIVFAGDVPCMAEIQDGGGAKDLNVMTRRGQFSSRMSLVIADGPIPILPQACATLFVALCDLTLGMERSVVALKSLDVIFLDESMTGKERFFCTRSDNRAAGSRNLYVIQLFAEQPQTSA
ncbi:MAG: HutD family protein [Rhizomicrobium sp.]